VLIELLLPNLIPGQRFLGGNIEVRFIAKWAGGSFGVLFPLLPQSWTHLKEALCANWLRAALCLVAVDVEHEADRTLGLLTVIVEIRPILTARKRLRRAKRGASQTN
jgi:hypothetical protein